MGIFDDIKTGLEQAIAYEKGELRAKKTAISIAPVEQFRPEEIKSIRKATGMTQAIFAKFLGVSVKTVEAWECGRNHPDGAASRLLTITRSDPTFPQKSGIVTV